MAVDSWMPIGYVFPDNVEVKQALFDGGDWQIYQSVNNLFILIVKERILDRWNKSNLIKAELFSKLDYADEIFYQLTSNDKIYPIDFSRYQDSQLLNQFTPKDISHVENFSKAYKKTRAVDKISSLHDSIYIEELCQILPTYSLSSFVNDDLIFGSWITGGINVSICSIRRVMFLADWINESSLSKIISDCGFEKNEIEPNKQSEQAIQPSIPFTLPGRPYLENFFNEHVIDIVQNEERYKTMGIGFPSAIILYGPPGTGKTFAVEALATYLGWPTFQIDSSSIGSSFIHGTSKKIAEIFDIAIKNAPSVLIIDEMESFLADREIGAGSSHHRVEEVAEFLRRIPEAIKNKVLIVAMTNRIDMIDPAILRRGRFDHHIKVDMASEAEISSLLKKLISEIPHEDDIDIPYLSDQLKGRPLSDVTFTVREAARLAARSGFKALNQQCCLTSLKSTISR
jgi:DNA-binding Lrp family transcriptional regulator